tara:strand:+ start:369 stop:1181 length:813 start_codon:yes stop_codon:yes gene_type:complete
VGWLIKVFDGYIKFNFHVGLAVLAMAQITALDFGFSYSYADIMICFTAPFFGYNFIKFHRFLFFKAGMRSKGFSIFFGLLFLSALLFLIGVFYLPFTAQLLLLLTLVLVLLYCLPLPGLKINFRGFRGLKIHLVTLSWVLTTVFLPLSIADKSFTEGSWVYGFQRYLFVLVATLPFEIRDLKLDDPHLSTLPQKLGISGTKILGVILLLFFMILEVCFLKSKYFFITIFIVVLLMFVLLISKAEQSKYFSSFWVEGIPILWLALRYNPII